MQCGICGSPVAKHTKLCIACGANMKVERSRTGDLAALAAFLPLVTGAISSIALSQDLARMKGTEAMLYLVAAILSWAAVVLLRIFANRCKTYSWVPGGLASGAVEAGD